MGKLLDTLKNQLDTAHKEDAEKCLKIYNTLKKTTGHVWDSEWGVLTDVVFEGFPSSKKRYFPSRIGEIFLNGVYSKE